MNAFMYKLLHVRLSQDPNALIEEIVETRSSHNHKEQGKLNEILNFLPLLSTSDLIFLTFYQRNLLLCKKQIFNVLGEKPHRTSPLSKKIENPKYLQNSDTHRKSNEKSFLLEKPLPMLLMYISKHRTESSAHTVGHISQTTFLDMKYFPPLQLKDRNKQEREQG